MQRYWLKGGVILGILAVIVSVLLISEFFGDFGFILIILTPSLWPLLGELGGLPVFLQIPLVFVINFGFGAVLGEAYRALSIRFAHAPKYALLAACAGLFLIPSVVFTGKHFITTAYRESQLTPIQRAVTKNDLSICTQMADEGERVKCYYQVAKDNADPAGCELIPSDLDSRYDNYSNEEGLTSSAFRDACFMEFNLCEKVINKKSWADCPESKR